MMGGHKIGGPMERQPVFIKLPLVLLCLGAMVFAFLAPIIYSELLAPLMSTAAMTVEGGIIATATGGFAIYPVFLLVGVGSLFALNRAMRSRDVRMVTPYVAGADVSGEDEGAFNGPMDTAVPYAASNYYLGEFFAEGRLTLWINIAAIGLIVLMMGGAL
jgi:ech hydrogenase subunit A